MNQSNIFSVMGIPFQKFLKKYFLLAVMGCVPFVAQTQTLPDNISNATCFITPPTGVWSIKENWKSTVLMNVCRPVLLGDLDNDKLPEIVAWGNNLTGEAGVSVGDECTKLIVYPGNNRNSALSINTQPFGSYYTVSPFVLVKVGGKGLIIISGLDGYLYAYDYPRSSATHLWKSDQKVVAVTDKFDALYNKTGPSLNVADFNGDGVPEVYSGNKIFNAQTGKFIASVAATLTDVTIGTTVPNRGFSVQNSTDNGSTLSFAADIDNDGKLELIVGNQIFKVVNTNGTFKNPITLYKSIKPPKITSGAQCDNDGHVSVADFNNDGSLDVLVSLIHKNTDAVVYGWDVKNNTLLFSYDVAASSQSFPFIGSIDANKNLEIMMITQATTGVTEAYLRALKLPTTFSPTAKLSSFWTLKVDESSGRTGITLFDFNQDGISELVYRDMTTLRIIDGSTNPPTQKTTYPNLFSPTTWEYPIVADVDGDGEAEIVTSGATSNINMGNLYIYKSNGSKWAPARSVWNQYSYNAVNVNEDLTIPPSQMNPATVFPGAGGVLGDGNDVRPYNGFLMQQTFLNKNGTPLFLAPHATIPEAVLNYNPTSGTMSISVTVKNKGNTALVAPFYITVYKNTVGIATTKYTHTHSSNINAGSSVVITFSIPNFKTWLPFTNIVVRVNDKGNGLSDQAVCSETGRDLTAKTVEFTAGLLNGPQDICINNKPYAFTSSSVAPPAGGTGTYTYVWESSPNDATWTVIAGANSEGYAPGVLTTTTYYRRKVTSGIYGTLITPSNKVTVKPLPTNFPDVEALPICQNTILRITYIIRNASTKYSYSLLDPQGASSNVQSPSVDGDFTFLGSVYDGLSNGGTPGKKTYTLSMYDKETKCTGLKLLPDLLTVNPLPIPDPISNKEFCVGAASVAFNGPDVAPAKCTWTNSNTAIGLAASGTGNLSFTATNNTNAPITATITMIAVSDKDCAVPNAKTFNITINPTPVLPTITAAAVCVGVKPVFVISDANTAYEYMIYNPAGVAASNYMTPAANGSLTIATFNAEATGTASTPGTKVYKVQVRNKTTLCINTKTVNVVVSPLPVFTATSVNVTCFGASNGTITIKASGGTGTKQYSKDDGLTWVASNVFTGLAPAIYKIKVKDTNGCTTAMQSITITQPAAALSFTVAQVNITTCFGAATGTITITATGGNGGNQYSKDDGVTWQSGNIFSGLGAGAYKIKVKDSKACTPAMQTVTITQPAVLTFTAVVVSVTCFGANNGSITVNATGGTGTKQYSKDDGLTWVASNVFSGLAPAIYKMKVKDANGCTPAMQSITITQPAAALSFTVAQVNITTCFGAATGTITITATGGNGSYQYSKDDGATWQSGNIFSGLGAGAYKIKVKDGKACTPAMQPVTITQPTLLTFTTVVVPVTCFGANNGSITVNAAGGTGTKQYSKDDGLTWVSSNVFSGLVPAGYKIKVKDANGCTPAMQSITITQPAAALSFTVAQVNITTCFGATTGSITVTAAGGNGSNQYSKDDGVTWQPSNVFSGLAAGTYNIKVKDSKGCSPAMQTVTIIQPAALTFTVVPVAVTCFGAANGTITITATGGTGAKQYSKDDGLTWVSSNVFNGLVPAVYKIKVKDANSCMPAMQNITIIQPTAVLAFTTAQVNITTCFGATTGSITVTATGGNGGNQYSKDDGVTWQSGNIFSGLGAGVYKIKVKDSKSCMTAMQTVTITQPPVLAFTTVAVPVTCFGANNGSITVNATGGTGTKQYSKDDGLTWVASNVFTGLAPAIYKMKVKDANTCTTAMQLITITQPTAVLAFTTAQVNVLTCFGAATGTITIAATGGNGSYQYSKDDGVTWQLGNIFSGLAAGAYKIKVKDSKACTPAMQTVTITQPPVLAFTTVAVPVTCFGANNGSITVNATGGTGTKQYSKDDGLTWVASNVFTGLAPAIYKMKVKDANSCMPAMQNITIIQPTAVLAFTTAQVNVLTCFGTATGTITITATGGNGSYQYSKDDGATWQLGNIFSGLAAGAYKIKVKDSKACTPAMQTVIITQPAVLTFTAVVVPVTCFGANNGSITVNATGGTGTKQYSKDDGLTWVSSNVFSGLVPAVYKMKVKDANSCMPAMQNITIIQPTAVLAFTTAQVNVLTCFGTATGTITITATGGNGSYQYSKDDGVTWQLGNIFSGLAAGAYKIKVKDSKACTPAMQTVIITQPAVLTFTAVVVPVTCFGANNGSITVNATGGTGTKQYSKDDGLTWVSSNVFSGLVPAVYKIKVKDANTCTTAMQLITITQPTAVLAFTTAQVNALTCFGAATGTITITATGGNGSYQYSKDDGATWQLGNIFSGLAAGVYNIKVKDSKGCSPAMQTVTITQPAALTFTATPVAVTCFGAANGTITITATGGTGAVQYSKDDGLTWQVNNVFSGLASGAYEIKVKDANTCTTAMQLITITQPTAVLAFTTAQVNVLTCFGAATGTITITAAGGNGSYQYSKDDGATWQLGNIFSGLAAGVYKIKVKDSKACTPAMQLVTITQPAIVTVTIAKEDIACNGANNGKITVTANGGTGSGTYQYSINNKVTWQASNVFSNLVPGTYTVHVKDGASCPAITTLVTITEQAVVLIPANVSSPLACPNKPSEVHIKNSVSGVTYSVYDAPTGGTQQGVSAVGNDGTLLIYVGTHPVSTTLYVETKSNGGTCTSISRVLVSIVVRDIVSQYPDIRIQICPIPNRTINLSSYLDTAYFHSVNWTTASVGSPVLTNPSGSASFQTNQLNDGTHAYYYTLSNTCYTNVKAKVYVNSFANTPHKRPGDTIVVCRNTSNMNLNQTLGLDAKGKWEQSADYNPYLGEVVPPSIFSGAFLLDVQAAYAGLQATTHKKGYRTDPTAVHVNLKYSTVGVIGSCWPNKDRDLVIIITSTQL